MSAMNIYTIKELLLSKNPVSLLYIERYIKLIEHAIENPYEGRYKEKHHILPKAMFPDFKDGRKFRWNLVKLSKKKHFIAHQLWYAFKNRETAGATTFFINCKGFKISKLQFKEIKKFAYEGENNGNYGKTCSKETKKIMKEQAIKRKAWETMQTPESREKAKTNVKWFHEFSNGKARSLKHDISVYDEILKLYHSKPVLENFDPNVIRRSKTKGICKTYDRAFCAKYCHKYNLSSAGLLRIIRKNELPIKLYD